MDEKIEGLISNFCQIARERLFLGVSLTFLAIHFNALTPKALAGLAFLFALHSFQMIFVNLSYQSFYEGIPKHNKAVKRINWAFVFAFYIYLTTISVMMVLK